VYIEAQKNHTPFFSAIVALSAALRAGNCVALKVRMHERYANGWANSD
jgi:aldehyde dehydrogenase (NAD+)